MMKYIKLLPRDIDEDKKYLNSIEGWNKNKIQSLRSTYNHSLPKAYLEFLKLMGSKIDSIPNIYYNHFGIRNLTMNEESKFICSSGFKFLKSTNFHFWSEDEYSSCFFNVKEGDNPPIYIVCRAQYEDKPTKIADSLSDFINKRRDNEYFSNVLIDSVLMKDTERCESIDKIKINLSSTDFSNIPLHIKRKIDSQYIGSEKFIATKIASDFIIEKSKYLLVVEGLDAMLDLSKGDIRKLQSRYFSFVFNADWDPEILINQRDSK